MAILSSINAGADNDGPLSEKENLRYPVTELEELPDDEIESPSGPVYTQFKTPTKTFGQMKALSKKVTSPTRNYGRMRVSIAVHLSSGDVGIGRQTRSF